MLSFSYKQIKEWMLQPPQKSVQIIMSFVKSRHKLHIYVENNWKDITQILTVSPCIFSSFVFIFDGHSLPYKCWKLYVSYPLSERGKS